MSSLINNKDLKIFKASYKLLNINKILNDSSFILFYYYDFLTQKDIILLKKFVLENNLNYSLLDKKSIRLLLKENKNFTELNEFLQGNIIILYKLESNVSNLNFIDITLHLKKHLSKITLFGIKLNELFYKYNKIFKINSIEDLNKKLIVIQLLNVLKVCHNTLYRLR